MKNRYDIPDIGTQLILKNQLFQNTRKKRWPWIMWSLGFAGVAGLTIVLLSADPKSQPEIISQIKKDPIISTVLSDNIKPTDIVNGDSLKQIDANMDDTTWRNDPELLKLFGGFLLSRDIKKLTERVPKLSHDQQEKIFAGMKEYGLLHIAIRHASAFSHLWKEDIESFLFQGLVPTRQELTLAIMEMTATGLYSREEIIALLISKVQIPLLYSLLDRLTDTPFEYIMKILWTEDAYNLGRYYEVYKKHLTPENQQVLLEAFKKNSIRTLWSEDIFIISETERQERISSYLENGDYQFFSENVKPSDKIDPSWLLAKMLWENEYLGILENSDFLRLQPHQKYEYTRAALNIQMWEKNGMGRLLGLVDTWIVPDEFLPEILTRLASRPSEILSIIRTPRLLRIYGQQKMTLRLLNKTDAGTLAENIYILTPTKEQSKILITLIQSDSSEYARRSLWQVWQYLDTLG